MAQDNGLFGDLPDLNHPDVQAALDSIGDDHAQIERTMPALFNRSGPINSLFDPRLYEADPNITPVRTAADMWTQNPQGAYLASKGLLPSDLYNQSQPFPQGPTPSLPDLSQKEKSTPSVFDSSKFVTPQLLDDYLKSKGSPMAGQGGAFFESGLQYGIDPRLLVALAGAETGFGKNVTWGQNNAFNWGYNTHHQSNSPFSDWPSAIDAVAKGIGTKPKTFPLINTSDVYHGFCVGPDCMNGLKNINTFMQEQGGDPNDLVFPH